MNLLRKLRFARRLALLVGLFAAGFLLYGAWSFRTLDALRVNGPLYADVVQGKDLIADVLPPPLYIIESYLVALQLAAADNQIDRDQLAQRLRQLHAQQLARQQFWLSRPLERGVADALQQSNRHAAAFYREAFGNLVPALETGDRQRAGQAMLSMKRDYELHRRVIDNLVTLAASNARYTENQAAEQVRRDSLHLFLILAAALALASGAAWLIARSITQPLSQALGLAQRIRAGDLTTPAAPPCDDEAGQLLSALHDLQQSLATAAIGRADADQALRRTRDLMERLLNCANVLVLGQGRHGEVLLFNEAAAAATGCPRERVLGRVWRDLPLLPMSAVSLWPQGGHAEQFRAMPPAHEHLIVTPSGDERRIAWRNTALEEGEIALVSFGIDVTEQREAQQTLAAARDIADSANRSKSAFLANMSHEIRTPLNAIIGLTELALQGELDERQRGYLRQVASAAASLLAMFNDILDFSRIEAGKLQVEESVFSVRDAAGQACAAYQQAARDKGLSLHWRVDEAVPAELVGDAARLQQLWQHLLAHAIRHTDQGQVELLVHGAGDDPQGTLLRCEVRDSGAARDAAIQLFEPLTQADGAAGLGLSVARQLAAMLGGQLVLESDPAHGNRFLFSALFRHALPAQAPSSEEQAAALAACPALCALGVDVAGALHRLHGNLAQLRKMLGQFAHGQAAIQVTLADAVRQGERPRAQRHAHTLSGLAAQLGMEQLRLAAGEVLQALRGDGNAQAELAALAPLLDAVLRAIHADLQAGAASGEQAA